MAYLTWDRVTSCVNENLGDFRTWIFEPLPVHSFRWASIYGIQCQIHCATGEHVIHLHRHSLHYRYICHSDLRDSRRNTSAALICRELSVTFSPQILKSQDVVTQHDDVCGKRYYNVLGSVYLNGLSQQDTSVKRRSKHLRTIVCDMVSMRTDLRDLRYSW